MGTPLLHVGATVICAHGGAAIPITPSSRVLVSGQSVATVASVYLISGCALGPAAGSGPCVSGRFLIGAPRVLVEGVPVVLQSSVSICEPTASSLVPVAAQLRVTAV